MSARRLDDSHDQVPQLGGGRPMSAVYFFECIACGGELPPKTPAKFDLCPACEAKYLASKTAHVALALAVRQWIQNELDAKACAATKAKVVGALRLVQPDGEVSR